MFARRPGERMTRGRIQSGGGAAPPITTNASAVLASFTSANDWNSAAGQGDDFSTSTTKWITFEKTTTSWPSREDLWGFQSSASTGWFITLGTGSLSLFWRGASGGSGTISSNVLTGLHTLVITRTAGGAFRASLDGGAVVSVAASPTYAAAGGSGVQFVGYNIVEATGACTACSVVNFGHINAALSDAELIAMSGNRNTKYRWDIPPTAAAHASLGSAHTVLDWDGSAATWVASAGSAPRTLTKRGTGGTRTAVTGMQRWVLDSSKWLDNEFYTLETTPISHYQTSLFANVEFTHSATRTWVEAICTQSSSYPYMDDVGLFVDGTQVQTQRLGGAGGMELFPLDTMLIQDAPTQTAASHTYILTNGLQSRTNLATPLKGTFAQAIWVPIGTTPSFVAQTAPTNRLVLALSDSTCEQLGAAGATVTTPTTDGWIMRVRNSLKAAGWRVSVKAWGGRSFGDGGTTAQGRTDMANGAAGLCDGTAKNVVYVLIGHNDKELNTYVVLATFQSDFDDYISKLTTATASKTGIVRRGITPFWGSNDAAANGGGTGFTMPQLRTAETTVFTTYGWTVTDGTTLITPTTGFGDGVHPLPGNPGHLECATAVLAFAELL